MDAIRFLLVLVGIRENGGDSAYMVSESAFNAAMFANQYECPVLGFVWCDTHRDWVRCDESGICGKCFDKYMDSLGQNESEDCYGWDAEPDIISDDDGRAHPAVWTTVTPRITRVISFGEFLAEQDNGDCPF